MAAAATYVTVREGRVTIAHNNLGAYEILEISVFGPEVTARFQAREQTRITRAELSTTLESITGRRWPEPRWPHFDG
ncbi:MAG TPA: hypothetical protein VFC19_48170 [Candidatus Limnocylindrales bacterium]|nr:hypothetical protein [Candidatus Limnocylindrales bacterium]